MMNTVKYVILEAVVHEEEDAVETMFVYLLSQDPPRTVSEYGVDTTLVTFVSGESMIVVESPEEVIAKYNGVVDDYQIESLS